MVQTEKQRTWSARIKAYKASGKTQAEWSRENNVGFRQLSYWLKKEKAISGSANTDTKWVPIEIKQEESVNQLLQIKIGPASVEVHPGFDKKHLSDVLKVLIVI